MNKYDADVIGCTGLLAGNMYGWQGGLRYDVAQTAKSWNRPATIITPMNGYGGWENFAVSIIRRRPKRVIFKVHSNAGKLATNIAKRCWEEKCPTEFVIVMYDRTLGYCPPMEGNVIAALDMHYDKSWLVKGKSFNGVYEPHDFGKHPTSHVRIINYEPARKLSFEFAERFKP